MSENSNEQLTDLQGNIAMKMLQELHQTGKITPEKFEDFKKKFQRLHDTIAKSF